jgi:glucan-binding YG repeat protein
MKNKLFIVLLISAMLMSPAAVFADSTSDGAYADVVQTQDLQAEDQAEDVLNDSDAAGDVLSDGAVSEEPAYDGEEPEPLKGQWDSTRTYYYDESGEPVRGLYKAPMKDHEAEGEVVNRLYYFDPMTAKVVNQTKVITVAPATGAVKNKRFVYSEEADGYVAVSDSNTNTYSYFIQKKSNGDCYIVSTQGKHQLDNGDYYYVAKNGTVKTTKGFAYYKNSDGKTIKIFVNKGGKVYTKAGWLYYNGNKYHVNKYGTVYTPSKTLVHKIGSNRYIFYTNGRVRRKVGIYKIKSTGKRYYVKAKNGILAKNKAVKVGSKVYHLNKYGLVIVGRHKWKDGKYYYSNDVGYLTHKSQIIKSKKGRYFAKKGGLIVLDKKIEFKGKHYICGKYGYFKTGMFVWHKSLYYANQYGVLRVTKGIFEHNGHSYYVGSGGAIYRNTQFRENGKIYRADKDGILAKGMYEWKGYYYLAGDDYVTVTQEGIRYLNGNYYFITKNNGRFEKNNFITYKKKHYYAGPDSAIITTTFTYAGVTITPSRMGEISDTDYYRVFPDQKPKTDDDKD